MKYATPLQVLLNIVMYFVILLMLRKAYMRPGSIKQSKVFFSVIIAFLYCLFAFWGPDYFHYKMIFEEISMGGTSHLEDVYQWAILNISPTYWSFRFLVWGIALVLLVAILKLSRLPFDLCFFFFVALYLPWFSYARVSLCMGLVFMSLAIIAKNRKFNIIRILLGGAVLFSSFYFHKSSLFGIAVVVFSLFLLSNRRWKVVALFVMIPVALYYLTTYMVSFVNELSEENEVYATSIYYFNKASRVMGPGEIIHNILLRTPYYLLALLYLISIFKGQYQSFPTIIKAFANASFLGVLLSTLFVFDLGVNTYVLYYRFLNYAMIPSVVFLSYCIYKKIQPILAKWVFYIGTSAAVYALLYAEYLRMLV